MPEVPNYACPSALILLRISFDYASVKYTQQNAAQLEIVNCFVFRIVTKKHGELE